jgi:hypothetical protein
MGSREKDTTQHAPANITGATTEIPGDKILPKDIDALIFSVCNVYFEAQRVPVPRQTRSIFKHRRFSQTENCRQVASMLRDGDEFSPSLLRCCKNVAGLIHRFSGERRLQLAGGQQGAGTTQKPLDLSISILGHYCAAVMPTSRNVTAIRTVGGVILIMGVRQGLRGCIWICQFVYISRSATESPLQERHQVEATSGAAPLHLFASLRHP